MEKEALKNIFDFLEEKENKNKPFVWKIMNNEPFTDDELNIKGNLSLIEENITYLPKGLKVSGNLNLRSCKRLKSLPDNLYVGGELDLESTNIKKLPKGLYVGDHLLLVNLKIKSLPDDLYVGRGLDLGYSEITSLPEGFEVREFLSIYSTKIKNLPKGLKVYGNLHIGEGPIVKFSDDEIRKMIEPGFIKGKIYGGNG